MREVSAVSVLLRHLNCKSQGKYYVTSLGNSRGQSGTVGGSREQSGAVRAALATPAQSTLRGHLALIPAAKSATTSRDDNLLKPTAKQ